MVADDGTATDGDGGRWVMDLDAIAFPVTRFRGGLPTRLAND
jgi:hypothetical protein